MKRARLLAAALAAMLLVPALASAAPRRPSPAEILRSPKLLARYLSLSATQVTQEEALFKTLGETLKGIHEQEKALRDQLQDELDKPSPNGCTAGDYVVDLHDLYKDAEAARQTFDTAFSAILTPEQLAKYDALKDLVRGPRT
jgi:Spy/CpxP family protein refolding chaperone